MRYIFMLLIIFFSTTLFLNRALACDSCSIPRLGRDGKGSSTESADKKWFAKYIFEQQVWKKIPLEEAHELHEDGHDVHVKTKEDYSHLTLGRHVSNKLTIFTEVPYVTRNMLEIEEHDRLGENEQSKGLGDLKLIGDYQFFGNDKNSMSFIGGIKLPTGSTSEKNSVGDKFEPEMQPGTGSYDYIAGGVYRGQYDKVGLVANSIYVFKTQGSQDFEFGDLFSTSLVADYLINPDSKFLKTKLGIDANFQYEQKQKDKGSIVKDSGGTMLLLGPIVSLAANDNVSFVGSVLYPVQQDMGGVHQELDFIWTVGSKIQW